MQMLYLRSYAYFRALAHWFRLMKKRFMKITLNISLPIVMLVVAAFMLAFGYLWIWITTGFQSSSNSIVISPTDVEIHIFEKISAHLPLHDNLWNHEADAAIDYCTAQFGNGFIKEFSICSSKKASLKCFHNPTVGSTICTARNLVLQPSLINVAHGGEPIEEVSGRREEDELPVYSDGAFGLNCQSLGYAPPKSYLPIHLIDIIHSVDYNATHEKCAYIEKRPSLFLTRYEYANLYHSITDVYNTYQLIRMFGLSVEESNDRDRVRIVFLDGHSTGALDDMWITLFGDAPIYVKQLPLNDCTCFERAFFVSPGYKSALSEQMMVGSADLCIGNSLVHDFGRFFIDRYASKVATINTIKEDLFGRKIDFSAALVVHIMIFRRDYFAHPRLNTMRVSRKIQNERELYDAANAIDNNIVTYALDLAQLSMAEQVYVVTHADILSGVHGAALTHVLLMPKTSSLIEISPLDYHGRPHFKFLSKWAGITYRLNGLTTPDNTFGTRVEPQSFVAHVLAVLGPMKDLKHAHAQISDFRVNLSDDFVGVDLSKYKLDNFATQLPHHLHRMCLLVPFRDSSSRTSQGSNRTDNLNEFIPFMIEHLKSTGKVPGDDFVIVVVEMTQGPIFNKGALFNAGFLVMRNDCDHFCLHDVDQLPEIPDNSYDWPEIPTHMCTASSQFAYKTAYEEMVGGVLMIQRDHYLAVNGYSNFYFGWGQEDDDFYFRLVHQFDRIGRLPPNIGRYKASSHQRVFDLDNTPLFNRGRRHLLNVANRKFDTMSEGLNTLQAVVVGDRHLCPGLRHLIVDLRLPFMPVSLNETD